MVDIRPNVLPDAILPLRTGDALIVDQGTDGVRQVDPFAMTDSVAPVASQAEAQAGTDNTKRMTSLRTKQSIASEVGVTIASNSQGAKADSAVQSVNGKTGNSVTIVKVDIGLGNVDNTSDANKPISIATQSALDGKASSSQGSKADTAVQSVNGKTGNSITLVKADLGLENVDNTSDANKPISSATQTALDSKANSSVTVSAGTGLTGGGNLTANRSLALSSASIASLSKADSSVQTVNGLSPTGGNVNVTSREVRIQDTVAAAISSNFSAADNFIITSGYHAPGDGGGGIYKRVASPPPLGANVVSNSAFSSDTVWVKGTGWTISGGSAAKAVSAVNSELYQNVPLVGSTVYRISYTISNYAGSGFFRCYFGFPDATVFGTQRTANGTYVEYLTTNPLNGRFGIQGEATVSGNITNAFAQAILGGFQSADGTWWELDVIGGASVKQFGARGDGSTNDSPAIQYAINKVNALGGVVSAPCSVYNLVTPITITQTTTSWRDNKRVSFIGDGSGLTTFRYTGSSTTGSVITWTTNSTGDTDGTYGNSWARIGGFFVDSNGLANTGITVIAKSWFEMDDIKALGAVERNFQFISTVSWSGRSLRTYGSKIGMVFELGSSPSPALSYTIPNNITLIDCTVGNATVWGVQGRNSGPINFVGGSFEGNGTQGTDASGGAYLITHPTNIGAEAVQANFNGTYFEHNKGGADIYVSSQVSSGTRVVNLNGCNFNRISSSEYTTNNVRAECLLAGKLIINAFGCGFNRAGTYVADASRRTMTRTGNPSNAVINFSTSAFSDTVDAPN